MNSTIAYHQMKHKKEVVNVIGYHNEREEEDEENRKDYSNKNIDHERTADNIFLKRSSGSYHKDIKEIVKSRTDKPIRKNAVMMVGHTIQFGGDVIDLPEEEQVEILKRGYTFISERYGENNVISATIHRDETNPHLHVDMVPMTEDGRLSARDIVTRAELRSVQSDLLEFMQEEYPEFGFDRLSPEERPFSNGKSQEDYERLMKVVNSQKLADSLRANLHRDDMYKLNEMEERLISREEKLDVREKNVNKLLDDVNKATVKNRQRAIEQSDREERQLKKAEELYAKHSQLNEKVTSLSEREESLELLKVELLAKDESLKLKEQEIDKNTENLNRMIENAHIPEIKERLEEMKKGIPLKEEELNSLTLTSEDLDDLIEDDTLQL